MVKDNLVRTPSPSELPESKQTERSQRADLRTLSKATEKKEPSLKEADLESISKNEMDAFANEIREKVASGEISPEKAASDVYTKLNKQSFILKKAKGVTEKGWHPSIKGTETEPNDLYRLWGDLREQNRRVETQPATPPQSRPEAEKKTDTTLEDKKTPAPKTPGTETTIISQKHLEKIAKPETTVEPPPVPETISTPEDTQKKETSIVFPALSDEAALLYGKQLKEQTDRNAIDQITGIFKQRGEVPPDDRLPQLLSTPGKLEELKNISLTHLQNEFPKVKIQPNGGVHGFFNQRRYKKLENGTDAQSQRFQELTSFLSKLNMRQDNIESPTSTVPRKNIIDRQMTYGQSSKTGMRTESFSARVQRRETKNTAGASPEPFVEERLTAADLHEHLQNVYGNIVKINPDASVPKRRTLVRNNQKAFEKLYAADPEFQKAYYEFYFRLYGKQAQEEHQAVTEQVTPMEAWNRMSPADQADMNVIVAQLRDSNREKGIQDAKNYIASTREADMTPDMELFLSESLTPEEMQSLRIQ